MNNVPNLRFPEFQGEWKKCKLEELSNKITRKNKGNAIQNVLSNSATLGLIPQNEYFDREIANSNNTDSYYVIEYGDFVYNPRKSVSVCKIDLILSFLSKNTILLILLDNLL